MITESPTPLPQEEVMGHKLRIHFNHEEIERLDEDGSSSTIHRCETAITHVGSSRAERIIAILASRYSPEDEIALLNNRGSRQGEYAAYLAFREQAKSLAGGAPDAKSAAVGRVNAGYEVAMTRLASEYPRREEATFRIQEAEVKAWRLDSTASTPFVDALVAERGIDKAELVERIITKAAMHTLEAGRLTGRRQRLEDAIEAATTDEEWNAIGWEATP